MLGEQRGRSNQHGSAIHRRLDAATGDGREIARGQQVQPARFGFGHDGVRQGMLGVALGAGGDLRAGAPRRAAGHQRERYEVGHRWLALGQRAGLVEDDRLDTRGLLQRGRVLDQDAVARADACAHGHRGWRGEAQRVGAGDDDGGDGEGEREERRLVNDEEPDQERQQPRAHRRDHQPLRRAVRQPLGGSLRVLRDLDQLHDLRERRLVADAASPGSAASRCRSPSRRSPHRPASFSTGRLSPVIMLSSSALVALD